MRRKGRGTLVLFLTFALLIAQMFEIIPIPVTSAASTPVRTVTNKVLIWTTGTNGESSNPLDWSPQGKTILQHLQEHFQASGFNVITQVSSAAQHFLSSEDLAQSYDMVVVIFPSYNFTAMDKEVLRKFLNKGGRIFFQCENPEWSPVSNGRVTNLLKNEFGLTMQITSSVDTATSAYLNTGKSDLLTNVTASHIRPTKVSRMTYSDPAQWIMKTAGDAVFMVEQAALKGRVTVSTDMNFFGDYPTGSYNSLTNLFKNMVTDSQKNMEAVAQGENPNQNFGEKKKATYKYQAAAGSPRTLPAAISDPDTATGIYKIQDTDTYDVNASVNRKGPVTGTTYDEYAGGKKWGTWTLAWDNDSGTMAETGLVFTGTWTFSPNYWTVTFDPGAHGTLSNPSDPLKSHYVAYDVKKVDGVPAVTETSGWKLVGWTKGGDTTTVYTTEQVKNLEISGDTTFTAAYKEYCTVTFTAGSGGTLTGSASQTVMKDSGKITSVPTVTATSGYRFLGWTKPGDSKTYSADEVKELTITADTAFTAAYERYYTVTFDAGSSGSLGEGSDALASQTVTEGQTVTDVPGVTAQDTHKFKGWTKSGDGTGKIYTADEIKAMAISGPTTFTAAYVPYYTVSFVTGTDGALAVENDPLATQKIAEGENVGGAPAVNANTGLQFLGWRLTGDSTLYTGETIKGKTVTGNLTFIAEYGNCYKVMFAAEKHGQFATEEDAALALQWRVPGTTGTSVPAIKAKGGYKFLGWKLEGDTDEKKVYTAEEIQTMTVDKNLAFTAAYRATTVYCTVSYETGGGTVFAPDRVAAETVVALTKTPVREGFTFTGWYTDSACTRPVTSVRVTENLTVYAGWRKDTAPPAQLNSADHFAYLQGYGDGTIRPESPITRAEAAAMLYRLMKEEYRQEVSDGAVPFADVTPDRWYYKEASCLALGGYLKGYPDGTFRGDRQITRAEFAAMAVRFLGVQSDAVCDFSDVSPSHWAYPYIATAANLGWMQGNGGAFAPERSVTRAEVIAVINRMLGRGVSEGHPVPGYKNCADNPEGAWYYWEIVEAVNSHAYTGRRPGEVWTGLTDARFDR